MADFSDYNPRDPWYFPPERLVWFAQSAAGIFKASRNKWIRLRPHPDARYVVFHELHHTAFSLTIFACLIQEKGLDKAWWNQLEPFGGTFDDHSIRFNNIGLREMLRYGLVGTMARQVEMIFRQVLHYLDPEAPQNEARSFRKVYEELLRQTGLENYHALLQLLLVIRDSLHHNAKFCPPNRNNLKIQYAGKTYSFQNETEIDPQTFGFLDDWEFLLFLVEETDRMLNEVFESPFVATLPYIKTRHVG